MLTVLNHVFPSACVSCNSVTNSNPLCDVCMGRMERLGKLFDFPKMPCDSVVSAFRYAGPLVDVLHRFKYEKGAGLSGFIVEQCEFALRFFADADAIVPVPISRWKLWRRGYNQSLELSKLVSERLNKPLLSDALVCNKYHSLIGLDRVQRERAVRASFEVSDEGPLREKRIMLVDDVMTTGATASACTRLLKRAGAKSVNLFVVARA